MAAEKTELRGLASTELVQALDALAHAEGVERTVYVNRVLDAHVRDFCHKQMLVTRMLRGNPYLSEPHGGTKE